MKQGLADFQNANCAKGCRFADKPKVDTGEPACTFCGQLEIKDGVCLTRRQ